MYTLLTVNMKCFEIPLTILYTMRVKRLTVNMKCFEIK